MKNSKQKLFNLALYSWYGATTVMALCIIFITINKIIEIFKNTVTLTDYAFGILITLVINVLLVALGIVTVNILNSFRN